MKGSSVFFIKLLRLGLVWEMKSTVGKRKEKKSQSGLTQGKLVCMLILNYSKMDTGHPARHPEKLIGMF